MTYSAEPLHPLPTGDVFVVGSGDCGQLGLGPDVFEKERPAMLHYFTEKEIVIVKAGGLHNVALSKDGKVCFLWLMDRYTLGVVMINARSGGREKRQNQDGYRDWNMNVSFKSLAETLVPLHSLLTGAYTLGEPLETIMEFLV